MNIEIRDGRCVAFPYPLKDVFRKVFPSAKWDATAREWRVAKGAETRLTEWAAEVEKSGILDELQAQETARLAEHDVRWLTNALASIKSKLGHENGALEHAAAVKSRADRLAEHLEEMKSELDRVREARKTAHHAAREAREIIMAKLREVADVDEIEQLRDGMKYDWRALKAINRERFDVKKQRLREIREQLTAIGLEAPALNMAISTTFSRPDRDRPDLDRLLEFQEIEG